MSPPRARGALACRLQQVSETLNSHLLVVSGVSSCRRSGRSEAEMNPGEAITTRRFSTATTSRQCSTSRAHQDTSSYNSMSTFTRGRILIPSSYPHKINCPFFSAGDAPTTRAKTSRKTQKSTDYT